MSTTQPNLVFIMSDDHAAHAEGLADDTIVVYTSDQGFFLGDHGWFDNRLMYEESLAMPLLIRYPSADSPGSVSNDIVVNVDFGPTLLDLCGFRRSRSRTVSPPSRGRRRAVLAANARRGPIRATSESDSIR